MEEYKDKQPLTGEQREYLKGRLVKEEERLIAELSHTGKLSDKNTGDWQATYEAGASRDGALEREPDRMDVVGQIEEYQRNYAENDTLETQLTLVRNALEKLRRDQREKTYTYGACAECGTPIDYERLLAMPAAHTCRVHMN